MVAVVVFEFGCMRCQPLRRALGTVRGAEIDRLNK
ncbi:phosphotransferase, partial [Vibrio cholerae]|nr:phosphotransferase [Vibrio cholerae]